MEISALRRLTGILPVKKQMYWLQSSYQDEYTKIEMYKASTM